MVKDDNFELAKLFFNNGIEEFKKKNYLLAEEFYNKSLKELPDRVSSITNLSAVQLKLGKYNEALINSKKSVEIDENNLDGWLNYGSAYLFLNKYNEALDCFLKILKIDNSKIEVILNLALTYEKLKKYNLAIEQALRAKEINKYFEFAFGYYIKLKLKICNWDNIDEEINEFNTLLKEKKIICSPLISLTTSDDPLTHAMCSEKYIEKSFPNIIINDFNTVDISKRKINIGYFSSDFRKHAVSFLVRDLFLYHDKTKFNLVGYNLNKNLDDNITFEIKENFNQFLNISTLNDEEAVKLIKAHQLDIAVDLNGYTENARTNLFINKIAPIQVNFLGYPGSMHLDCYDYIITDKIIINERSKNVFKESLVIMPDSYQINSRRNDLAKNDIKRIDYNLPDDQTIFCCFNRSHKILPSIFNSWMNILKRVEKSVLWLFYDNQIASTNLIDQAKKRGVNHNRIIFAEECEFEDHLERQKLADIFLDTFPYNAHTTCIDAIWAGLPVITLQGNSFSSRVASSILNSLNLNELITSSLYEYELKAIELANDNEKLLKVKKAINEKKINSNLFKTDIYTKYLENAYEEMIFNHNEMKSKKDILINEI